MTPPVATTNAESCVIPAPADKVWGVIRSMDFAAWYCSSSSCDETPTSLGSTHRLTFKDGTVWTVSIVELSDLNKTLSFDVVSSDPNATVTAATHSITIKKITKDNTTFMIYETQFSAEGATAEAVADSKYKKLELFDNLIKKWSA
jgi:hypothetical protein